MLLFASNLAGTKLISPHYRLAAKLVAAVEWLPQRAKLGRKNAKRTLLSAERVAADRGSNKGPCIIPVRLFTNSTKPTLSELFISFTYFFCEILCPERQNYLKILCFLFFFSSEKNTLELNILAKYWNLPGISTTTCASSCYAALPLFFEGTLAVTPLTAHRLSYISQPMCCQILTAD